MIDTVLKDDIEDIQESIRTGRCRYVRTVVPHPNRQKAGVPLAVIGSGPDRFTQILEAANASGR